MKSPRNKKVKSKDRPNKPVLPVPSPHTPSEMSVPLLVGLGAVLVAAGLWAYWPNLVDMIDVWGTEPDYSHGYLVLPIALAFLWVRWDRFPQDDPIRPAIFTGLALIGLSVVLRYFGAKYFFEPIDTASLLFWVAGTVLALFGWRIFRWSLPSIVFLWFAMPLPHRVSFLLRQPMQEVATKLSSWVLLMLGYPAVPEGSVIRIDQMAYGVDEACSGLRVFLGIAAFAFALVIISRRSWVTKGLLLLSVFPVAIISNSTRIIITCILYQNVSSDAARHFSHDVAGLVMIPFAGGMLCLILWLLSNVFKEVEVVRSTSLFREQTLGENRDTRGKAPAGPGRNDNTDSAQKDANGSTRKLVGKP